MSDQPVTEPRPDDRTDENLTADQVMDGDHVSTNTSDDVQEMGIVSGVGSGTGASDVEPADDYPTDNDGETVD